MISDSKNTQEQISNQLSPTVFSNYMRGFAFAYLNNFREVEDQVANPNAKVISKTRERNWFTEKEFKQIGRLLYQGLSPVTTISPVIGYNQDPFFIRIYEALEGLQKPHTIENLIVQTGLEIDFEVTSNSDVIAIVLKRAALKNREGSEKENSESSDKGEILSEVLFYNATKTLTDLNANQRFLIGPYGPMQSPYYVSKAILDVARERQQNRGILRINDDGFSSIEKELSESELELNSLDSSFIPQKSKRIRLNLNEHPFEVIYKTLTGSVNQEYANFISKAIEFDLLSQELIRPDNTIVQEMIDAFCPSLSSYIDGLSDLLKVIGGNKNKDRKKENSEIKPNKETSNEKLKESDFDPKCDIIRYILESNNLGIGCDPELIISDAEIELISLHRKNAMRSYSELKPISLEERFEKFTLNQLLYYSRLLIGYPSIDLAKEIGANQNIMNNLEQGKPISIEKLDLESFFKFYDLTGISEVDKFVKSLRDKFKFRN